ncbi:MAG: hydroxyacid dehydrogenase [Armatimonadetes bacterium]|nr:hydroxyacid dehydrogenase [Armatimonadota bacterium]
MKILVLPSPSLRERLFAPEVEARLRALGEVTANPEERNYSVDELADLIPGFDACLTSWGSPAFTPEVVEKADSLRVISHAAGSVRHMIGPEVFERGIAVCSAQPAMAISVAAMTVAMMEIMLRNVVNWAVGIRSQRKWRPEGVTAARELNGKRVGIIGASLIGREVIRYIQPYGVELWISDPYISAEDAESLGAKKVSLKEIFAECEVISIHAPLNDQTRGMITGEHLKLIRDGAVLINTSRGAIIDHEALLEELKTGRFSAALDVTDPEPLPEGHEFFGLENVVFTPHISGGTPEMVRRQGEAAVRNLELFFSGGAPNRLVTAKMMEWIA